MFYPRALADPDWGIKLTGKEGHHAVAFYSVMDNITNLLFPASRNRSVFGSTSLDMKSLGTVLRYRRDIGKVSTLGVLLTDREGKDYFNRLGGVDAYLRFTRHKQIRFQFIASQTRYPDQVAADYGQPADRLTGTALDFAFRHSSRNFGYYLFYQQITPKFRADLGFLSQVDYRNIAGGFILASWRNPGHWYTFINVTPQFEYEVDFDNNLIYKTVKVSTNYNGPAQTFLTLTGSLGKRAFMGNVYDTNSVEANLVVTPVGDIVLGGYGQYGDQIDFSNNQGGTQLYLAPFIVFRPGRHIWSSLDYIFERFNVDAGRLYTANIIDFKLIYNFSRRAFLRTILQYYHYKYNTENYSFPIDPEFKHLFTQVLFSYKINPRTMLFLGYSDDHYGFRTVPLKQNNRTIFLKIGYALVL